MPSFREEDTNIASTSDLTKAQDVNAKAGQTAFNFYQTNGATATINRTHQFYQGQQM